MFPTLALIVATRESAGPDSKTLLCTGVVVACKSPVFMWTFLRLFMTIAPAMIKIMVMVKMPMMAAMIRRLCWSARRL